MKMPPFNPSELRAVIQLVEEGKIPMKLRHVRQLCRQGKFPAIWVGKGWSTTEGAVRAYLWKQANSEFKKITS